MLELIILFILGVVIYFVFKALKKVFGGIKIFLNFISNHSFIVLYIIVTIILTAIYYYLTNSVLEILLTSILIFAIRMLTYKHRAIKYIIKYVSIVLYDIDHRIFSEDYLTEAAFFSNRKTKRILSEGIKVKGYSSIRNFMSDYFRKSIFAKIQKEFNPDKIVFASQILKYDSYFEEQDIDLDKYFDDLGWIEENFTNAGEPALISKTLLNNITSEFVPFLEKGPELSGVFSKKNLCTSMLNKNFLSKYIEITELSYPYENKQEFLEELNAVYDGIAEKELSIALKNNKIKETFQSKDEQCYCLNHENELGIIKEEYGMETEQHRVVLKDDPMPENDPLNDPNIPV